ncbi:MAG: hypothetical protein GXX90_04025 [Microbacteriaceae bacterium]|nr:hypothetical protein [Microbacteriaceae bacterium]
MQQIAAQAPELGERGVAGSLGRDALLERDRSIVQHDHPVGEAERLGRASRSAPARDEGSVPLR